jgi:type I site-specific restriction endonuclease
MVGRGTRQRPDLFRPGRDKKYFYIFDYCQNLEFFSQNPETTSGSAADSLSKTLFANRVERISELDKHGIATLRGPERDVHDIDFADAIVALRIDLSQSLSTHAVGP